MNGMEKPLSQITLKKLKILKIITQLKVSVDLCGLLVILGNKVGWKGTPRDLTVGS